MKKTILLFSLIIGFNAFSQAIAYSYDANGNRVMRALIVLDPGPTPCLPAYGFCSTDGSQNIPEAGR